VEATIAGWDEEEKRQAIRNGLAKQREWLQESLRAAAEELGDSNDPNERAPEFVKESFEVFAGDRRASDSEMGKFMAMGGACCCLDIIWIPLGLFFAYRIATGRP